VVSLFVVAFVRCSIVRCSIPHCMCMGHWWSDTGRKTEVLGEKSVSAATLRPFKKLYASFRRTEPLVRRWQTVRRSNPADSSVSSHRHERLLCLYRLLINRLHDKWCNSVSVSVLVSWHLMFVACSKFRITFWFSVMATCMSTVIDTISPDFYISNGLCPKM